MLSVKRLEDTLSTILSDGVEGVCLMTTEGSLLSYARVSDNIQENLLAAVSTTVFNGSLQSNLFASLLLVFIIAEINRQH
jgi:predicted regulator of Ras-like GTPase activity (Roadblock/LC7/MglB family)